jgi:hypothetical protein
VSRGKLARIGKVPNLAGAPSPLCSQIEGNVLQPVLVFLKCFSRAASQAALQPGNLTRALAREISRLGLHSKRSDSKLEGEDDLAAAIPALCSSIPL